jgi:hypothetical protein
MLVLRGGPHANAENAPSQPEGPTRVLQGCYKGVARRGDPHSERQFKGMIMGFDQARGSKMTDFICNITQNLVCKKGSDLAAIDVVEEVTHINNRQ